MTQKFTKMQQGNFRVGRIGQQVRKMFDQVQWLPAIRVVFQTSSILFPLASVTKNTSCARLPMDRTIMRAMLVRVNARALVNSYKNPTVSGASISQDCIRREMLLSISISIGRSGAVSLECSEMPRQLVWQAAHGLRAVGRSGTFPS